MNQRYHSFTRTDPYPYEVLLEVYKYGPIRMTALWREADHKWSKTKLSYCLRNMAQGYSWQQDHKPRLDKDNKGHFTITEEGKQALFKYYVQMRDFWRTLDEDRHAREFRNEHNRVNKIPNTD